MLLQTAPAFPASLRLPRFRPLRFVSSKKEANVVLQELWANRHKPVAVDSEFNEDGSVSIWSLSYGKDHRNVITGELLPTFADWFAHKDTQCDYQNYKADRQVFGRYLTTDILDSSFAMDIMCASHIIYPNDKRHGLKYQGVRDLGWRRKEYQQLFCYTPSGKSRPITLSPKEILQPPLEALQKLTKDQWFFLFLSYAADDAEETSILGSTYRKKLGKYCDVFFDPIIGDRQWTLTLMAMEQRGIHVDKKQLINIMGKVSRANTRASYLFRQMAGKPDMNIRSNPQMASLIFKELQWPTRPDFMTKAGNPQLNAAALDWYVTEHGYELARVLQDEKRTRTLKQTLISLYAGTERDDNGDDIVYTELNQVASNTGRISSRKRVRSIVESYLTKRGQLRFRTRKIKYGMQLQNMPVRKDKDPWGMRRVFISVIGQVLICCDYSGFELMMAVMWASRLVKNSKMLQIMQKYGSPSYLHAQAAKDMFNLKCDLKDLKEQYPDEYTNGKRGNFNLLYGGMAKMFCRICGWDVRVQANINKANRLIKLWFKAFPEMTAYHKWCEDFAQRNGYIIDISGQRFDLTEYLNSPDEKIRQHGLRKAKNTPCQGSAAKIVRAAGNLIELDSELRKYHYVQRLHVHDEIIGTCPSSGNKADYVLERKIHLMKKAGTLYKYKPAFELDVTGKIATNWLDAKG